MPAVAELRAHGRLTGALQQLASEVGAMLEGVDVPLACGTPCGLHVRALKVRMLRGGLE